MSGRGRAGLFAFPAQSNATGVRHPLEWAGEARRRGWRVALDAAAYLPTGPLDLTAVPADFVALSWYKITGFPTGVGCLIARRDALAGLDRPWFAGGTVRASSSHTDWHLPAPAPEGFEDGTLPFLALPDVTAAVAWHRAIGYDAVHRHVTRLTVRLLDGLTALRHPGGEPAVRVLGPLAARDRGPTVTFNLLRPDGSPVDERALQRAAAEARISLRTGCFCNPGVAEEANGMTPEVVREALVRGLRRMSTRICANSPSRHRGRCGRRWGWRRTHGTWTGCWRCARRFWRGGGGGVRAPGGVLKRTPHPAPYDRPQLPYTTASFTPAFSSRPANWVRYSSAYRPSAANSPSCVPRSMIRPASRTRITSAERTVERRWAMTRAVRSANASVSASWTAASDVLSRWAVASSRMTTRWRARRRRAMVMRWRSPPERR
ncbi:aminotransferase class V-fold PLP-dependent enzyme [Streptomyces sp. LBUM 1476]|nr:aminotransferase class V-fold PLP-dependent enzyme [Streptomyces sp. LBUM 1476]